MEYRAKLKNTKLEELEKVKQELEEWKVRKEQMEENGDEFTEVFDKIMPTEPEEEND